MRADLDNGSRILGCILGGALGDAWGGPWEGNPGRVAFQIPSRASVSDDTQLTLATCESIIENGGVHAERLASHFATWFATGRVTGIGASTLKAMGDLVAGVHWAVAGSRGEFSAQLLEWDRAPPRLIKSDISLSVSTLITKLLLTRLDGRRQSCFGFPQASIRIVLSHGVAADSSGSLAITRG